MVHQPHLLPLRRFQRSRSSTRTSTELLKKVEQEQRTRGNCLFYLATSPHFFTLVVKRLGEAGLTKQDENHWRRVVIEKPFGQDLPSAVALNRDIREVLDEKQIFRIDHYLGKETVQNILAFPLRQRHFRAGVEPPLRRSRAGHRGRRTRRRAARRLLRPGRRAARHGAQSHLPAHHPHRHGAAHLLRRGRGSRRADQSSARHPAAQPGAGAGPGRARPIRRGRRSTASAFRPIARNPTSTRIRTRRRSSRWLCTSTIGAGPACLSICAPASGSRSASRKS